MDKEHLVSEIFSNRLNENLDEMEKLHSYYSKYLILQEENTCLLEIIKKHSIPIHAGLLERLT
ncbi:MAG: hypothetical protein J6O61_02930 [Butyrivibrio sp.]|uniref:hypothetical protein n=1 Tax=Butyrivibrio sp. TaxID=28121 RepID=UPI001B1B04E1|nr:hypothetical protein [Butyrivibrio sp.]MBO6239783.1 hypothetical protein [Butyrivibrio sp.]